MPRHENNDHADVDDARVSPAVQSDGGRGRQASDVTDHPGFYNWGGPEEFRSQQIRDPCVPQSQVKTHSLHPLNMCTCVFFGLPHSSCY